MKIQRIKTYETISSTVCEYNKVIPECEKEENFFSKTISSFDGSEVVFIIDGKVYGEIEELKYDSIKKEIEITMALFSTLDKIEKEYYKA